MQPDHIVTKHNHHILWITFYIDFLRNQMTRGKKVAPMSFIHSYLYITCMHIAWWLYIIHRDKHHNHMLCTHHTFNYCILTYYAFICTYVYGLYVHKYMHTSMWNVPLNFEPPSSTFIVAVIQMVADEWSKW